MKIPLSLMSYYLGDICGKEFCHTLYCHISSNIILLMLGWNKSLQCFSIGGIWRHDFVSHVIEISDIFCKVTFQYIFLHNLYEDGDFFLCWKWKWRIMRCIFVIWYSFIPGKEKYCTNSKIKGICRLWRWRHKWKYCL